MIITMSGCNGAMHRSWFLATSTALLAWSSPRQMSSSSSLLWMGVQGFVPQFTTTTTRIHSFYKGQQCRTLCSVGAKTKPSSPDFTVLDDDDDNNDDETSLPMPISRRDKSPKAVKTPTKRRTIPLPDITVLQDDDNNNDNDKDEKFSYDTDDSEETPKSTAKRMVMRQSKRLTVPDVSVDENASWMDRNTEFSRLTAANAGEDDYDDDDNGYNYKKKSNERPPFPQRSTTMKPRQQQQQEPFQQRRRDNNDRENYRNSNSNNNSRFSQARRGGGGGDAFDRGAASDNSESRTFRQDFRGTRVFVQGLPAAATWQDLKDHFKIAGPVVFASVSTDPKTGASKGHGIVQFETTAIAQNAIDIMRDHPLQGSVLFVRPDVQEKPDNLTKEFKKGPTPPTKWKCANEENANYLSEEERKNILSLIKARDDARRRRNYDASDVMREQLKREYNVHVDDRLQMWWTAVDGDGGGGSTPVPKSIQDIKGDGRWGNLKPWRQIPTTPENDACVNADLVQGLLRQRDIARREKDFATADSLLLQAREAPDGNLYLRIHDESRTWRVWTEEPPPARSAAQVTKPPGEQCLDLIQEYAPEKYEEVRLLLERFPGREYNILRKLKQTYVKNTPTPET